MDNGLERDPLETGGRSCDYTAMRIQLPASTQILEEMQRQQERQQQRLQQQQKQYRQLQQHPWLDGRQERARSDWYAWPGPAFIPAEEQCALVGESYTTSDVRAGSYYDSVVPMPHNHQLTQSTAGYSDQGGAYMRPLQSGLYNSNASLSTSRQRHHSTSFAFDLESQQAANALSAIMAHGQQLAMPYGQPMAPDCYEPCIGNCEDIVPCVNYSVGGPSFGRPCNDQNCREADIFPCLDPSEGALVPAQVCDGTCNNQICNAPDCPYRTMCEWSIDGSPCSAALPGCFGLAQHISRGHVPVPDEQGDLKCHPRASHEAVALQLQAENSQPKESCSYMNGDYPNAIPSMELRQHIESAHGYNGACQWLQCNYPASAPRELIRHLEGVHIPCVNPQTLDLLVDPVPSPTKFQTIHSGGSVAMSRSQSFGSTPSDTAMMPSTPCDGSDGSLRMATLYEPPQLHQLSRSLSSVIGDRKQSLETHRTCKWVCDDTNAPCGAGPLSGAELQMHIEDVHVPCGKRGKARGVREEAPLHVCRWKGCKNYELRPYETRQRLKEHIKMAHTQPVSLPCPICDKAFGSKKSLNQHEKIHREDGQGAFVCDTCGKRYKTKMILGTHKRQHTEEKPFVCSVCGHRDSDASNFKRHVQGHEAKELGLFKCERCGTTFVKKQNIVRHQKQGRARCDLNLRKRAGMLEHQQSPQASIDESTTPIIYI